MSSQVDKSAEDFGVFSERIFECSSVAVAFVYGVDATSYRRVAQLRVHAVPPFEELLSLTKEPCGLALCADKTDAIYFVRLRSSLRAPDEAHRVSLLYGDTLRCRYICFKYGNLTIVYDRF